MADATRVQDPLVGTKLGSCVLRRRLGAGGMGTVYLGHHEGLNKPVAVKILSPDLMKEGTYKDRFLREARTAAKLDNPNVVTVYDVGESSGVAYIVMHYVEGRSLDAVLRERGKLTTKEALQIARRVAIALGAAHKLGIVHRDVKPANILISKDGLVKVADFGLARDVSGGEKSLSQTGEIVGTPNYMAPEQASGGKIDGRTDLYSLGATLYHLVTGQVPFAGTSALSIVVKHLNETPAPPEKLEASIPKHVSALILRLMAKNPAERFASAEEMVRELDAIGGATARKIVAPPKKRSRWPILAAAAGAVVLLLAFGYFVFRPKTRAVPDTTPGSVDAHDDLLRKLCANRDPEEQKEIRSLDKALHAVLEDFDREDVAAARSHFEAWPAIAEKGDLRKMKAARFGDASVTAKSAEVQAIVLPEGAKRAVMNVSVPGGRILELAWAKAKDRWVLPTPAFMVEHPDRIRRLVAMHDSPDRKQAVEELDKRLHLLEEAIRWEKWGEVVNYVSMPERMGNPQAYKEHVKGFFRLIFQKRTAAEIQSIEPVRMEFAAKGNSLEAKMVVWIRIAPKESGETHDAPGELHWICTSAGWKLRGPPRDR